MYIRCTCIIQEIGSVSVGQYQASSWHWLALRSIPRCSTTKTWFQYQQRSHRWASNVLAMGANEAWTCIHREFHAECGYVQSLLSLSLSLFLSLSLSLSLCLSLSLSLSLSLWLSVIFVIVFCSAGRSFHGEISVRRWMRFIPSTPLWRQWPSSQPLTLLSTTTFQCLSLIYSLGKKGRGFEVKGERERERERESTYGGLNLLGSSCLYMCMYMYFVLS